MQKIVVSLPVDHSGATVYLKGWQHRQSKRALVVVSGIGETISCYDSVVDEFVAKGYSVYVYDLRGHGRSGRRMGHIPSFLSLVNDLLQVAAWVKQRENGQAPVILGCGVGAVISCEFARQYPQFCSEIVMCSPTLDLIRKINFFQYHALKICSEILPGVRVAPMFLPTFLKEMLLSLQRYNTASSTAFMKYSFKFLWVIAFRASHGIDIFKTITDKPILVLHSEFDPICSYRTIKKLSLVHNNIGLKLKEIAGENHHFIFEKPADVVSLIDDWFDVDLQKSKTQKSDQISSRKDRVGATKSIKPDRSAIEKV